MRAVEACLRGRMGGFWLYSLVAAFSMKRGRVPWSRELGIRAVIVVVVILLVRFGAFQHHASNTNLWLAGVGLVLFALGLGFAIWARLHIGRNWGTPMTQKDEPELVTSGPYHLVRHPIYSGILVAGVGTAVALSWLWLIAVALAGVYFVYSAKIEEHYLTEQFPDTYPVYRRSTKMLVHAHPLSGARSALYRRGTARSAVQSWCPRGDVAPGRPQRISIERPAACGRAGQALTTATSEPWISPGGMSRSGAKASNFGPQGSARCEVQVALLAEPSWVEPRISTYLIAADAGIVGTGRSCIAQPVA